MTDVVGDNNDNIGSNFSSLTKLTIGKCHTLSSIEQFLHPAYVPGIKIIEIQYCHRLVSLPSFRHSSCLEELKVCTCPNINSSSLYAPSLKKLELKEDCGNLADNIDCSSLTYLHISQSHSTSIQLQISAGTFPSLTELTITNCSKLQTVDDLHVSFPLLTDLLISHCQLPNGQKGMKLPASLKSLELLGCEDLSAWFPRCLENLASLMFMKVHHCKGELSIPGHMWSSNLASLRLLQIHGCPDLVSVGGPKAIAGIEKVWIERCPKFKELKQPVFESGFREINVVCLDGTWAYTCLISMFLITTARIHMHNT
ncbi:uncharacterized protein [Setaria viridis]|uniref:uncharacterized protein n=1 Tax=Setaria viridis TaxID=4556 RepID=UPI003B3B7572